jgi:hypothetical protein
MDRMKRFFEDDESFEKLVVRAIEKKIRDGLKPATKKE